MLKYLITYLILLNCSIASAQKVGLVLSGGGAKGLAHIGTLKALEENNIPIDYITGTSMGGIVGAMYASGYTPSEIEQIALSSDFQDWVVGRYKSDYTHFFRKSTDNASLFSAKLMVKDNFRLNFRSNLISDIPLNFALQELLSQASAAAENDFNKLFVPFRTMVSDVLSQESIAVKNGNLAEAVRATMSVPLIYRATKLDGKFVFDGGLYNNFPVDVMKQDFNPDFIIGANVSSKTFNEYPGTDDERLMNQMLMFLFLAKSDSTLIGNDGVYIQPDLTGINATMFSAAENMIKKGYEATMAEMPKILASVKRSISTDELHQKRKAFNRIKPYYTFNKVTASGINSQQKRYVERLFKSKNDAYSLEDIRRSYYKLVADETFETVYPSIKYDQKVKMYHFDVIAEPTKNLKIEIGGNISTRPISNVFLGLQYNYLRRKSYTVAANFYSGKFYESVQLTGRVDFSTRIPMFLGTEMTYNNLNYFSSSRIFIENMNPTYIEQSDRKVEINWGIPLNNNSKIVLRSAFLNNRDRYSPTNTYNEGDALDRTIFNGWKSELSIDQNTLNRKQYANSGKRILFSASYVTGQENYSPGNILRAEPYYFAIQSSKFNRKWWKLQFTTEDFFVSFGKNRIGYLFDGVISNQPLYANYYSTILSAPAFLPLQDSKTLFLNSFRASSYLAGGIRNVYAIKRNLDFRVEAYAFLPAEPFVQVTSQKIAKGDAFSDWQYAGTAGMVYSTRLGPISLSYNLYSDPKKKHGVLLHLGYLIYNKRSLE